MARSRQHGPTDNKTLTGGTVPDAWCICGDRIVQVAGVWWHLGKVVPRDG